MAKKYIDSATPELLKKQEKANQYLRDLVQSEKEGMAIDQTEFRDIKSKLAGLDRQVGNIDPTKTAEMLSKNLGAEEAFTREMSHDMSIMFSKNNDMQVAYQKGSTEEKSEMLSQMKHQLLESYKQNTEFFKNNKDFIENAMEKVDDNMDKIVETGSKMLYPIISGMTRSLDDFRHTLSDKYPKVVGRFLSDAMVEHYKTGAKEIGSHFQQHMSAILAPLDAITGPIIAVSKSLFTIGKTLFSGPTKHEKETSKVQREIRDTLRGQREAQKTRWFGDKRLRMKLWIEQKRFCKKLFSFNYHFTCLQINL